MDEAEQPVLVIIGRLGGGGGLSDKQTGRRRPNCHLCGERDRSGRRNIASQVFTQAAMWDVCLVSEQSRVE